MSIFVWTWIITGASFALYIWIAWATRAGSTSEFYAAEQQVPAYMNAWRPAPTGCRRPPSSRWPA